MYLIYARLWRIRLYDAVDINKVKPIYFILHNEVFKYSQDGKTRNIRVVFNASAKPTNGKSLNGELLIGPKLQNHNMWNNLQF